MKEIKDDLVQTGFAVSTGRREELQQIDLPAIAEQLSAIAAELRGESSQLLPLRSANGERDLRQHIHRTHALPENGGSLEQRRILYAEFAREAYATRRRRSRIFQNDELFGEPAWDILLDLYIAHVEKKSVSVSSACIGSAAPPTTGLRWLGVLADQQLVMREHDPEDQRRVLVRLTERGLTAMDEYFASAGLTA
jgi:hypothetical protein